MSGFRLILLLPLLAFGIAACDRPGDDHEHDGQGERTDHGDHESAEVETGPHGGRLLEQDGYAVELQIFEAGVPPRYRAWLYRNGAPLPPEAGRLQVILTRLGGVTDTHSFAPEEEHLVGSAVVHEPHSFDVEVRATIDKRDFRWAFESHEGRTRIAAAVAEEAGIRTAPAGPGVIRDERELQGLLTTIEGRQARVVARFPGPVREVLAGVGDEVRAGQVLARVESNVSLSEYSVTAPFAGTVLAREAAVGELAGDRPLFELADLSKLWVDLHLFGPDAQQLAPGMTVEVVRLADGARLVTRLDRVLPGVATASQSTVARATIDNADGQWRPGAAVRARVTISERPADRVVPLAAVQSFRDWQVVFVRVGEDYEIRPLELGGRDSGHVEVLGGLEPGADVVVEQSYLVKADIEKSGASHDH